MSFKQSYLVPKAVYDNMKAPNSPEFPTHKLSQHSFTPPKNQPADVQLKLYDYNKKFPFSNTYEEGGDGTLSSSNGLFDGIQSQGKKSLAEDIVKFINTRGGGEIDWRSDYKIILDGQTSHDLDIRDILAFIVGAQKDFQGLAAPIILKLYHLNAPSYFFMFYKGPRIPAPRKRKYYDSDDDEQPSKSQPYDSDEASLDLDDKSLFPKFQAYGDNDTKVGYSSEPSYVKTLKSGEEGRPFYAAARRSRSTDDGDSEDGEITLKSRGAGKPSTHTMSLRRKKTYKKKWEPLPT